jgi:hypothetical protein
VPDEWLSDSLAGPVKAALGSIASIARSYDNRLRVPVIAGQPVYALVLRWEKKDKKKGLAAPAALVVGTAAHVAFNFILQAIMSGGF